MATQTDHAKITVDDLLTRIRSEMVPMGKVFSYFLVSPIAEEDLKQYLDDPIGALPPALCATLPSVGIILAPYLEKGNGRSGDYIGFEPPPELREELAAEVHGEVDERSWRLKQSLLRRQSNTRKETKLFQDYARQALEDTL